MTDGPSIPPPPPSAGSSNLVSRAINILTKPASEWRVIDGEAASIGGLIAGYRIRTPVCSKELLAFSWRRRSQIAPRDHTSSSLTDSSSPHTHSAYP